MFFQVLDWPAPLTKGLGKMEGPSINSVAMDPDLHYLVALSDKNMVIVWKTEESSWVTPRDFILQTVDGYQMFGICVVRHLIGNVMDYYLPHMWL